MPSRPPKKAEPLIQHRPWAVEPFWRDDLGIMTLSWRRRAGKSFMMASKSLRRNMIVRGNLSVFLSASIRLGSEFILKEAQVWKIVLEKMRKAADLNDQELTSNADGLEIDDIADLFEHQKLETKIWHDRTTYSRSIVLAPNPDTAVGYGGDLYVDEYGRIPDFQDLLEAILPFLDENQDLRCVMASTPPPDDAHYSYELTCPPTDEFELNPKGNWYESKAGFLVHRVDAFDTYKAGFPMYDSKTREEVAPDTHRANAFDKNAWDRNYGVRFIPGGQSALSIMTLHHAMVRGENEGRAASITEKITDVADVFPENWKDSFVANKPVGMGLDLATTEKGTSNPSALSVIQHVGQDFFTRLVLRWKTADPEITEAIVMEALKLPLDLRCRRLCVDATNERFFSVKLQKALVGIVHTDLIISSENIEIRGEKMTYKSYLGNLLVNTMDDSMLSLPNEDWISKDMRLVKRDRGSFTTEIDESGNHGDTFDSTKLALHALLTGSARAEAHAVRIGSNLQSSVRIGLKNPYAHKFKRGTRINA